MSLFLEGLQSAREIVQNKGIAALEDLIEELQGNKIETTALKIQAEVR